MSDFSGTQKFSNFEKSARAAVRQTILAVRDALDEKGYEPISQIVGYVLSGDPTYITGHNNARGMISKLDRDELLEELVHYYIFGAEGR